MQTNPASRLDATIAALHAADYHHTAAEGSPDAEAVLCAAVDAVHAEAGAILSRPALPSPTSRLRRRRWNGPVRARSPGRSI